MGAFFPAVAIGDADDFNKDDCLENFERIGNGCDGSDEKYPMNWRFNGSYFRSGTVHV